MPLINVSEEQLKQIQEKVPEALNQDTTFFIPTGLRNKLEDKSLGPQSNIAQQMTLHKDVWLKIIAIGKEMIARGKKHYKSVNWVIFQLVEKKYQDLEREKNKVKEPSKPKEEKTAPKEEETPQKERELFYGGEDDE